MHLLVQEFRPGYADGSRLCRWSTLISKNRFGKLWVDWLAKSTETIKRYERIIITVGVVGWTAASRWGSNPVVADGLVRIEDSRYALGCTKKSDKEKVEFKIYSPA